MSESRNEFLTHAERHSLVQFPKSPLLKILLFNLSILGFAISIFGLASNEWLFEKAWVDHSQFPKLIVMETVESFKNESNLVLVKFTFSIWGECMYQVHLLSESCEFHGFHPVSGLIITIRLLIALSLALSVFSSILVLIFGPQEPLRILLYSTCCFSSAFLKMIIVALYTATNVPSRPTTSIGFAIILGSVGISLEIISSIALLAFILSSHSISRIRRKDLRKEFSPDVFFCNFQRLLLKLSLHPHFSYYT